MARIKVINTRLDFSDKINLTLALTEFQLVGMLCLIPWASPPYPSPQRLEEMDKGVAMLRGSLFARSFGLTRSSLVTRYTALMRAASYKKLRASSFKLHETDRTVLTS